MASYYVRCWATAGRTAPCPSEVIASAGTGQVCASDATESTDNVDHQWNALHPTSASAHESVWRSQLHHAELAGVACPVLSLAFDSRDALNRRPSLTPLYLRRIPLLI
jgi:hypothetical protein